MNEPDVPPQPAPPPTDLPAPTTKAEQTPLPLAQRLWARLKEHKVVQWTLAYMALAYTLLHGAEMLGGALDWPHSLLRIFTLVLILGVPIVAILAWYHGAKGRQRVSGMELAILTLLLVVAGTYLWTSSRQPAHRAAGTESEPAANRLATAAPTAAAISEKSVAVLPFENRSDEHKDAFFVDGIHDDILTQLTKIGAIKVIARTSVEQFRGTKLTTKEIGAQLGVTRVLEGSVQRAGDRVRVTVQLIDATTDAHLWAESYDRELTAANIFAIQSEVAATIAGALKTTLTPVERKSINAIPTQNLDAWEAYQLGQQRMAKRTSAGLAEAEKFFQSAIDLDPKFALAYVGLADTVSLRVGYSGMSRVASLARAEQAVGTALKLDPNLAEAWASSAGITQDGEQYDRAESMFRRAIALNPNYATAYLWFSFMLANLGRLDEALSLAERAAELDPLSPVINMNLGGSLYAAGRIAEAEARFRKVIEIDPSTPYPYATIGGIRAYALNRFADAVPLLQKAVELDPGDPDLRCSLGLLYLDLGAEAQASGIFQAARQHWPDAEYVLAYSVLDHLYRGAHAAALQDAHKLLAVNPRAWGSWVALVVLRDADLIAGRPDVARARYAQAYPEFFAAESPKIQFWNWHIAIDLVLVLQKTGASARASALLDRIEEFIRSIPRMGQPDFWITDVQISALRGQKAKALAALRAAVKAGWRGPSWRYYRDFDLNLSSIRNEPEFKAVFADVERDMARQRAELAARPKNAPLDLKTTSN